MHTSQQLSHQFKTRLLANLFRITCWCNKYSTRSHQFIKTRLLAFLIHEISKSDITRSHQFTKIKEVAVVVFVVFVFDRRKLCHTKNLKLVLYCASLGTSWSSTSSTSYVKYFRYLRTYKQLSGPNKHVFIEVEVYQLIIVFSWGIQQVRYHNSQIYGSSLQLQRLKAVAFSSW
jgi:hypothetical protein